MALIRTLTAFYVFSGWRKAGDVNTLLEEGFFFKKKRENLYLDCCEERKGVVDGLGNMSRLVSDSEL